MNVYMGSERAQRLPEIFAQEFDRRVRVLCSPPAKGPDCGESACVKPGCARRKIPFVSVHTAPPSPSKTLPGNHTSRPDCLETPTLSLCLLCQSLAYTLVSWWSRRTLMFTILCRYLFSWGLDYRASAHSKCARAQFTFGAGCGSTNSQQHNSGHTQCAYFIGVVLPIQRRSLQCVVMVLCSLCVCAFGAWFGCGGRFGGGEGGACCLRRTRSVSELSELHSAVGWRASAIIKTE